MTRLVEWPARLTCCPSATAFFKSCVERIAAPRAGLGRPQQSEGFARAMRAAQGHRMTPVRGGDVYNGLGWAECRVGGVAVLCKVDRVPKVDPRSAHARFGI